MSVEDWTREAQASWPKAWAIDNIPSIVDDAPYASYDLAFSPLLIELAGFGPLSNGVPQAIGDGGASERRLPPPIGKRCVLVEEEATKPLRRKA